MKNKLKVSLLANTGLGNEVFNTLINHPQVVVDSVVTRKFENEYPFFKSKELHEVAISKGVKCFCNIDA